MVLVRKAEPSDLDALTGIWHEGWRDAHLAIVPEALARLRTREQFQDRLSKALARVRVAELSGMPIGFAMLRTDEVYQFYLAAEARGTGAAMVLMRDAEAQLASEGTATAWLSCAIGNARAARFYEKAGWVKARVMVDHTETTDGPFALETWRFEKRLSTAQAR